MSLRLHFCPVCCIFTVSLSTSYFTHHNICQCNTCCQMNSSSIFLLPVTCFEFGFVLMGHSSTILVPLRLFKAGALDLRHALCPPSGSFEIFPLCSFSALQAGALTHSCQVLKWEGEEVLLVEKRLCLACSFLVPDIQGSLFQSSFWLRMSFSPSFQVDLLARMCFVFCSPLTWECFFIILEGCFHGIWNHGLTRLFSSTLKKLNNFLPTSGLMSSCLTSEWVIRCHFLHRFHDFFFLFFQKWLIYLSVGFILTVSSSP